ncbi:MAG: L-2-hydroxyglutarate oxidase, partial [Acidobacteria bacterium]|nr:L-2-hydroxyglutarate oxidase [Acidobacteriota bacterium]
MSQRADVVCIGAGIIGLATARSLARRFGQIDIHVVEAEPRPAVHQTGHNSGVIHSGLYYKPGSLKARNCVGGRKRLIDYCDRHAIPYEICGKLVIATDPEEIPRLDELERRGRANGLAGLERLPPERIPEFEPHATGVDALWVPETGIVDFKAVARAYAQELEGAGVSLHLRTRVTGLAPRSDGVVVETTAGEFKAGHAINCAGLQSDRVARMAGLDPDVRIVPFRGEYFDIAPERRHLLRGLIYPVPDPRFPFLGVHLTRRVDGSVEAGPNAVLALKREGYDRRSFDARDTWSSLSYPGFWKMALRFWKVGISEMAR